MSRPSPIHSRAIPLPPSSISPFLPSPSTSFKTPLWRALVLVTAMALSSFSPARAQVQTMAPVAYAGSAILADGGLYLYGGVVRFSPTPGGNNTGTNQFQRLDLTKSFSATSPPQWTSLPNSTVYSMITAVPTKNGRGFVLGGNRDNIGTIARVYDIDTKQWTLAPDLPGLEGQMQEYKRSNVGMSLDPVSGLVYIYGGFQYFSFSSELSALDTSSGLRVSWSMTTNQTTIPPLYEPFVCYLPTVKKTMVIAGCTTFNPQNGFAAGCVPLTTAYLVSASNTKGPRLTIDFQVLSAAGPSPRYQSCHVTLENGDVFIQGGRNPDVLFGDAWVLNVKTWTWSAVSLKGPALEMTRAAHTCERGPLGQILVIGGYSDNGRYIHATPQLAVIDTKTWTWSQSYTGAPTSEIWKPFKDIPNDDGDAGSGGDPGGPATDKTQDGLSSGAIVGLAVGFAAVLGLVILVACVLIRRKKKKWQQKLSAASASSDPAFSTASSWAPLHVHEKHGPLMTPERRSAAGAGASTGLSLMSTISASAIGDDRIMRIANHIPPQAQGGPIDGTNLAPDAGERAAMSAALVLAEQQRLFAASRQGSSAGSVVPLMYAPSTASSHTSSPANSSELQHLTLYSGALPSTQSTSSNFNSPSPSRAGSRSIATSEAVVPAPLLAVEPTFASTFTASPATSSNVPITVPGLETSTPASPPPTIVRVSSHQGPPPLRPRPNRPSRILSSPQSVPEDDAFIERSSPGVKSHVVSLRGLDSLLPPLTPSSLRSHHSSVIVGSPTVSSPMTPSPGTFSGTIFEEYDASSPHLPSPPRSATALGAAPPVPRRPFLRQQSSFKDPQMAKDLDDIVRRMDSQSESKGPHAIVLPEQKLDLGLHIWTDSERAEQRALDEEQERRRTLAKITAAIEPPSR